MKAGEFKHLQCKLIKGAKKVTEFNDDDEDEGETIIESANNDLDDDN